MAIMIPNTLKRGSTAGERLVFSILKKNISDDCLIYYEPFIHNKKPDYIIIHPSLGIIVLEVKDYKKSTLLELNHNDWVIAGNSGKREIVKNPLNQARGYAFDIVNLLKSDESLLNFDTKGVGRLGIPYSFGVVFTKLDSLDIYSIGIDRLIPDNLIITRDELNYTDESNMFEKISGMFTIKLKNFSGISKEDLSRIRYHLFPEVRLGTYSEHKEENLLKLKNLKAMSVYQELLAKQSMEGPRLIRGVAGSGKTLIMVSRVKLLAKKNPNWKILVLCYGIVLSKYIKELINMDTTYSNVEVMTFHEFFYNKFKGYSENNIDSLVSMIENGHISYPLYDSISIDEGQDFDTSWVKLVSKCLNREMKSLFIAEDRSQDIFRRKTSLLESTGLDFRGRSKVLSINYRNTKEVVDFAWKFYKTFSSDKDNSGLIDPKATDRKGHKPVIRKFLNVNDEVIWVSKVIKKLLLIGEVKESEIAILYRVKKFDNISYIDLLRRSLFKLDIPYKWVAEDKKSKENYKIDSETVSILTIDSSKGLDFKVVFIIGVGIMPLKIEKDEDREISLLYIGMTRSLGRLFLTYTGESKFTNFFGGEYENRSK